jgi:hypothetical protein
MHFVTFVCWRSIGSAAGSASKPTLLVRNVGSFEASFAPTLADLDRLDPRFRLQPDVWRQLPGYEDFGFAVFQLRPGLKRIHPMALEFPRRDPESLFFPTVHVHDGGSVPRWADFDHKLFFQSARTVGLVGSFTSPRGIEIEIAPSAARRIEEAMGWFASSSPAGEFMRHTSLPPDLMDLEQNCYLIELHGQHDNRDVYLVEGEHVWVTDAS